MKISLLTTALLLCTIFAFGQGRVKKVNVVKSTNIPVEVKTAPTLDVNVKSTPTVDVNVKNFPEQKTEKYYKIPYRKFYKIGSKSNKMEISGDNYIVIEYIQSTFPNITLKLAPKEYSPMRINKGSHHVNLVITRNWPITIHARANTIADYVYITGYYYIKR